MQKTGNLWTFLEKMISRIHKIKQGLNKKSETLFPLNDLHVHVLKILRIFIDILKEISMLK